MRVTASADPASMDTVLRVDSIEVGMLGRAIYERVVEVAAEHIASVFLEQHQQDVLARLNPEAIANLAVAAAGGAIRETLEKKMPDVTHIIRETKTEVLQRGIFGGLRRI